MSRLVVVSNRVAPITEGEPTSGGLAAGVLDALKHNGGIWFGWSGEITDTPASAATAERTLGPIALFTVDLSRHDYDEYYRGYANGTLWPTLHYQVGHAHFDWAEFAGYRRVNELFAEALVKLVRPDDLIWAHDYHLLCLAEALRAAGLRNRIGLFLHTPFPAPAVFMTDPAHTELVRAMCRFDLLGFQTESDRTAFSDYVLREAGGTALDDGRLRASGCTVKTGVYPIGVHVDDVREEAAAPTNRRYASRLRASLLGRPLILGVDRLDYFQGPASALHRVRAVSGAPPAAPWPGGVHADRAAVVRRHRDLSRDSARTGGRGRTDQRALRRSGLDAVALPEPGLCAQCADAALCRGARRTGDAAA
jgi:trehalose 6-phosphate synthase